MSSRIDTRARRLLDLRMARDETKAAATKAEKAYRAFEAEFWDELEEEHGIDTSIDLDLGPGYGKIKLTRRETIYAQVIDPERLAEAARELGRDDEWITRPDEGVRKSDFRAQVLNEHVREAIEHEQELPHGLDFRFDRGITITRKKG